MSKSLYFSRCERFRSLFVVSLMSYWNWVETDWSIDKRIVSNRNICNQDLNDYQLIKNKYINLKIIRCTFTEKVDFHNHLHSASRWQESFHYMQEVLATNVFNLNNAWNPYQSDKCKTKQIETKELLESSEFVIMVIPDCISLSKSLQYCCFVRYCSCDLFLLNHHFIVPQFSEHSLPLPL